MASEIIKVPDLGDSGEVEVIELLVSVGQTVAENDSLLVLESDKAAMEIPAPMGGIVKSIAVNLGDQVKTGSEMLTLEVEGAKAAPSDSQSKTTSQEVSEKGVQKGVGDDADTQANKEPAPEKVKQVKSTDETTSKTKSKSDPDPVASQATLETLYVPDLGGEQEVEVIEIHVKSGDDIGVDDILITLESDKAAMDVPSESAGKIKSVKVKVGDKVSKGSPMVELLSTQQPDKTEVAAKPDKVEEIEPVRKPESTAGIDSQVNSKVKNADELKNDAAASRVDSSDSDVYAGPAVRKLARELGVNLVRVNGSGAKGRIIKEDIYDYVKSRINGSAEPSTGFGALPDIDFSQFGEIEQVQRSKLHKLTAVNMHRNWSSIPHVAQFNEADVTDLEEFRAQMQSEAERKGVKLTFLPFLLKACAKALKEYPQFNVSLHSGGEFVVQKKYIHIGVAVATEAGLLVPVIRDVDKKSLWELAAEIIEITDKAKQRRLNKNDLQGACFTISSLGAIGGTGFIPIINAPEVSILGVGKTQIKPVYEGDSLGPRKMLPLTLSYDHRALNGVDGGQFSSYLVKLLGDIRLLLL